jgi:creatinine amidohydrolase
MKALADLTWPEARQALARGAVAILPVGATEAHGPHLALSTDVVIAEAMARAGADELAARGVESLILPALAYTCAGYAAGFAGTLSVRPETATTLVVDVAESLARHGARLLALANAHLEPAHIASIEAAAAAIRERRLLAVAFPDVTRRPWALRLTEEFQSGACHAGRYEGSVVLAERPDRVREEIRRALAPNPVSLGRAIREGRRSFEEAGGPQAYFGDPAAASPEEGAETIAALGGILAEAVLEALAGCT